MMSEESTAGNKSNCDFFLIFLKSYKGGKIYFKKKLVKLASYFILNILVKEIMQSIDHLV